MAQSINNNSSQVIKPLTFQCFNTNCKNIGTKICTACRTVKYCSVECQKKHFPMHKEFCKKIGKILNESKISTNSWCFCDIDEKLIRDHLLYILMDNDVLFTNFIKNRLYKDSVEITDVLQVLQKIITPLSDFTERLYVG